MRYKFYLTILGVGLLSLLASPALAGDLDTHNTAVDGKNRTYKVYEPDGCKDKACPVLFMFHGLGGTATGAVNGYKWQQTADQNNFLVVFPESLTIPGKDAVLGNRVVYANYDPAGKHWDIGQMKVFGSAAERCESQDINFTKKLITNQLSSDGYDVLDTHVFTTGHSYGALFSYYASMCLPNDITAFAAHSGGLVTYKYWMFTFYWPLDVRPASEIGKKAGMVISAVDDNSSGVKHQWSLDLDKELGAKGHTHKLAVLPRGWGHKWDHSKNQTQWNFFMTNSPDLPEPPPPPVEPMVANFTKNSSTGLESGGGANVTVTLSGDGADENIIVRLVPSGSATENSDYNLSTKSLTFTPGQASKTVSLNVLADDELENNETVVLDLVVDEGNAVPGNTTRHTHTIIDDTVIPPVAVNFSSGSSQGLESAGGVVLNVKLNEASENNVTVGIVVQGTTQLNDYSLSTTELVFTPGEVSKNVQLSVLPDDELENNETVILDLGIVGGNAVLGNVVRHTHTIVDDTPLPPVVVGFNNQSDSGLESAGGTQVTIVLDDPANDTVVVAISTGGTAVQGADYNLSNSALTFNPGDQEKTISLNVLVDDELENNETITLNLTVSSGNAVLGNNTQYVYTIIDDTPIPPVEVNFSSGSSQGLESAGRTQVMVVLDGPANDTVVIAISTKGSATENSDYNLSTKSLTFTPGQASKTVSINVADDEEVEENETVVLNLAIGTGNAVLGGQSQYTHTIVNNDEEVLEVPEKWSVRFFAALKNNLGVIWQKNEDPNWAMTYDYNSGTYQTPFYDGYTGYTPLDVEASWKKSKYFWWVMWRDGTGRKGLWRRDSGQNDSLDRSVVFNSNNWELKDMAINKYGKPFILWQNDVGNAVIERYSQEATYQRKFEFSPPDNSGWEAKGLVMDRYNRIRLLWVKGNSYRVEMVKFRGLVKTWTPVMTVPAGYDITDFDVGWRKSDQSNRLMLVNGSQAKVQKVSMSGSVLKEFNFDAPEGYGWHSMETTSNNYINLILNTSTDSAESWKVHYNTGKINKVRKYSVN